MLEIIPLGGAAEIGKNMLVVRFRDDIVVLDAGVTFPTDEHPGVDLIIPDYTYLLENAEHVRAFVLTHAHEDHVGALPYVLADINAPVYGTPLTLGLLRHKLAEHRLSNQVQLRPFAPGEMIELGTISVEPIHVTHSIPDTVSLALHTPVGVVVHTGDFKIDHTPIDGRIFDASRFAQLGDAGVALLISDTTNAERPGWVRSEKDVAAVFDREFQNAPGRVLVTTFASNLHRVQIVFDTAARRGRRVAVAGRSMERNVEVAREMGYLKYQDACRARVEDLDDLHPAEIVILTTGSQGEALSALSRMACDSHKIQIQPGDTVILSSRPIPGNEDAVWRTVNRLFRRGARVLYDMISPVHVSGHAHQEELKLMYNLTRPRYVVPFHGEPRMMHIYTEMIADMGHPRERILWLENGTILNLDSERAWIAGQIETAGDVLIDGVSEGGVADFVIRDRKHLANDGTVIVTVAIDRSTGEVLVPPDFISRGFLHPDDSEELFVDAAALVADALHQLDADEERDWDNVRTLVRDVAAKFLRKRTQRRPVVIPVVLEI